jgi:hypothetical protein
MTSWNSSESVGTLECGVTELLNQVNERGVPPEAMVRSTARLLCLFALASRPTDVPLEAVQSAVMHTVREALVNLGEHPFSRMDVAH